MNDNEHLMNTHDVGNGRISVTSNDHGYGTYTTMCDHGATTSGATYITVSASGHITIHWGDSHYTYTGDALAIVSYFASTLSMGKTANFIKRTCHLEGSRKVEAA